MSNFLISVLNHKFFSSIYKPNPDEINILDEAFILISIDPPFRLVTLRNLLRLIYYLSTFEKLHLKDITNFNETYVHSTYKLMEYLQNEIFAGFMFDVFEEHIKSFE